MRRYINASVNSSTQIDFEYGLGGIISETTLNSGVFEPNGFSFYSDFRFCKIPENYDEGQYPGQYLDMEAFGMVKRDGDFVIPAGMSFDVSFYDNYVDKDRSIRTARPRYRVSRNGVSIIERCVEDWKCLSIRLTDFGYRCYLMSEDLEKPFISVVKEALVFSKYFLN